MTWNNSNQQELNQLEDEFAVSEVEDKEFESIPDGKYQVKVDKVEMTHSKVSNKPMLKWCLKIIGPTHKGRLIWRNNLIDKDGIKWLKQDLYTCGLQLEKLSDLPNNLDKLLDIGLEVSKRTKDDYENIYINRKIVLDDTSGQKDLPF